MQPAVTYASAVGPQALERNGGAPILLHGAGEQEAQE